MVIHIRSKEVRPRGLSNSPVGILNRDEGMVTRGTGSVKERDTQVKHIRSKEARPRGLSKSPVGILNRDERTVTRGTGSVKEKIFRSKTGFSLVGDVKEDHVAGMLRARIINEATEAKNRDAVSMGKTNCMMS